MKHTPNVRWGFLIRIATILALLLVSASAATSRSWLGGTWVGTGYQIDDNSTWSMKLTVAQLKNGRRRFSIEYPSLNCGGRWKLLNSNRRKLVFREQLSYGQEKCSDNGRVRVERINSRQILFLYSNQGSREIIASAVLNRKRS
jgi:hypothetical protein